MNPETKNTSIDKSSTTVINSPGAMDEKTYQQYKLDSRKILVRSAIITAIVGALWSLVIPPLSILFALFIAPVGVVGIFVYLISLSRLNIKYKIPNVYRNNGISFSKDIYHWHATNNNFLSNDPFRDNNPTCPGTASWHARRLSE